MMRSTMMLSFLLINAVKNYIKGNTNPLVQKVELLMLKKKPEKSVKHFVEKVKENSKLCELRRFKTRPIIFFSCASCWT
jgi:hypothetical protein